MEKPSKDHPFFAILFSKVRGSVRYLGGLVGSRFGRFEVPFWEVQKVRGSVFSGLTQH